MYIIQEEPVTEGAALLNHSEGYCLKYLQSTVLAITAQKGREGRGKEWVGILETFLNEGAYVPRSSRYKQGIANQQVWPQEDGPAASSSTNYSLAIAFFLLPWLIYTPKDFWSVFI